MSICLSPAALTVPTDQRPRRIEYRILAVKTPQIMLRILGLFAQRDLVPYRVRMDIIGDVIWLALNVEDLTLPQAEIIAERLRTFIDTMSVDIN